jgi:hypothetical protein
MNNINRTNINLFVLGELDVEYTLTVCCSVVVSGGRF